MANRLRPAAALRALPAAALVTVCVVVVALAFSGWTDLAAPSQPEKIEPAMQTTPMCEDVYGADDALDRSVPNDHTRIQRDEWVADLHSWAQNELPDKFAGTYDETVAFTDDVESLTEEVHARFGDHLEVVEVDHSLSELEAVRRDARQELDDPTRNHDEAHATDGQLTDATVLPRANRVRLTVADLDDARADELTERYGATRICLLDDPGPTPEDSSATRSTVGNGPATDAGNR